MSFILPETLKAQIEGITLRTPPITHAFIDGGDILAGIGLAYSKIENPGYNISGVTPETVTTTEKVGFLALGIFDGLAIGVSTNPTEIEISGTNSGSGSSVNTTLRSSRTYYYIIPTIYRWQSDRIALIWGRVAPV